MRCSTSVRLVNETCVLDKNKVYYNGCCEKYLVYAGFNVKCLLKIWTENKFLKCGNFKSLMDARKHKDAVVWGAGVADEKLPTGFYDASNECLKIYKKIAVQEKSTRT